MNQTVLVYVRPWSREFYPALAREAFPGARVVTVSDFRKDADHWIGSAHFASPGKVIFSEAEVTDIITRCRFLRIQPFFAASALVHRVASYLDALLDGEKAARVIGTTIDNYTTDILERLCVRRRIPFHSFCGHFINGYCRLTARGELVRTRPDVSEDEVEKVLSTLLRDEYRPAFLVTKTVKDYYRYWARELVKRHVYFPLKRIVERDPLNYHYGTIQSENLAELTRFKDTAQFSKEPSYEGKTVYLPLHLTPEATVDYWCADASCAYYEASILSLIRRSSPEVRFLVKENPAMLYVRNPMFYDELLSLPNVQLIHPGVTSNQLVRNSGLVYVYTGSVGVEALLRGKKVLARTPNYYSNLHPGVVVRDSVTPEDFESHAQFDEGASRAMIKKMLEGLIPARFHNNWNLMSSDLPALAQALRQAAELS